MKKLPIVAVLAACLVASNAMAAGDLSKDGKRLVSYGTLAVMVGACGVTLTPAQDARLKKGMTDAAEAQDDLSPEQFTEVMKSVGTHVGETKDKVCPALTPEFVDNALKEAASGE